MAISHITKLFGVEDCKIALITADVTGGITYATPIDVPGIKNVTLGGDVTNVELRGDNGVLDSDSKLASINVTFEFAKLDLDLIAALMGGTVADSGSGSTEIAKYTRVQSQSFPYFGFAAKCPTGGGDISTGDVWLRLPKCKLRTFPGFGLAEEDYQIPSVEAVAVQPIASAGLWMEWIINETATALAF
jgi:hypothetical protein